STARTSSTSSCSAAKQRREEVAEAAFLIAERGGEFEVLTPIRWRPEFLALAPVAAKLIVRGALLRIFQDLVRFLHFLEASFRVLLLAHVRMIFARKPAIDALQLVLADVAGDAHDLVVVLVLRHGEITPRAQPLGGVGRVASD